MRGVAISPVLAVVLVLVGIVYTVYVFDQDTNVAKGITKEGEIKKAIVNMDKKLMSIPGIARNVLTNNQFRFEDDSQVEKEIENEISQELGINARVSILGGNWERTRIRVFIPSYKLKLGDTQVSVSNLEKEYTIEAPRPSELHKIYQTFNGGDLCSFIKTDSSCSCCEWVNGSCVAEECYYKRQVDILSFDSYEHNKYNMGRVIFFAVPETRTSCFDSRSCGGGCGCWCRIGQISYKVYIYDPKNQFVYFKLPNRNGGDTFSCLD